MAGTTKTQERVAFLSKTHANTRFIINRETEQTGRSQDGLPILEPIWDKEKFAQFVDGICATDDPVVIAWLEAHRDMGIYRGDDDLADVRFTFGDATVQAVEQALAARRSAITLPEE